MAVFGTTIKEALTGAIVVGAPVSAQTIAAAGVYTSAAIDLNQMKPCGYFGLQYTITGTGTVKIQYLLSNDGTTYVVPDAASDIGTSLTASSGAGSDGKGYLSFSPECARYMKIRVTETGASTGVVFTGVLAIQA